MAIVCSSESVPLSELEEGDLFLLRKGSMVHLLVSCVRDQEVEAINLVDNSRKVFVKNTNNVYPIWKIDGEWTRIGLLNTKDSLDQKHKADAGKAPAWDFLITELWDFWVEPRLSKLPWYLTDALRMAKQDKWEEAALHVLSHSDQCALAFQYGAEQKYSKGSWQSMDNAFWRVKQGAGRHLQKMLQGHLVDDESKHQHQTHLEWCVVVCGWYQQRERKLVGCTA